MILSRIINFNKNYSILYKNLDIIKILNLQIFSGTNFFSCEWQEDYHSDYKKYYYNLQLHSLSLDLLKNSQKNGIKKLQTGGIYLILRKKNFTENMRIYIGKSEKDILQRIYSNFKKDKTPISKIYLLQGEKLFANLNNLSWFEKELIDYFQKNKCSYFICDNQNRSDYLHEHSELKKIFFNVINILIFFEPKIMEETVISPIVPEPKLIKTFSNLFILKGQIKKGGEYFAQGFYLDNNKFNVLKDSWTSTKNFKINFSYSRVFLENQKKLKLLLVNNKIKLDKNNNKYIFLKNYTFNSPSNAAEFFKGLSTNGPDQWKDKETKKSLNHYKDNVWKL